MRSRDELRQGCADLLKNLRAKSGLSKSKMAAMLYIDDHTWSKYETGQSAPSVPDFLYMYNQLGVDALPAVLSYVYPETYGKLSMDSSEEALREAAAHYFKTVASEQTVREWCFIVHGGHGSNVEPQMQLFTMYEHLPMAYRYAVAQLVDSLWTIAESQGQLIATDHIMPDIKTFRDGLIQGRSAAMKGHNSYTTVINEEVPYDHR